MNYKKVITAIKNKDYLKLSKLLNYESIDLGYLNNHKISLIEIIIKIGDFKVLSLVANHGFLIEKFHDSENRLYTPLELCIIYKKYEWIDFIAKQIYFDKNDYSFILSAANADRKTCSRILDLGYEIDHRDFYGRTALHWACQEGNMEVFDFLLERKANPNIIDDDGVTPLYLACSDPKLGLSRHHIVDQLLKYGAIVDMTNDTSPFQIACTCHQYRICRKLVTHGADINFKDRFNYTALDYAIERGDKILVGFLNKLFLNSTTSL